MPTKAIPFSPPPVVLGLEVSVREANKNLLERSRGYEIEEILHGIRADDGSVLVSPRCLVAERHYPEADVLRHFGADLHAHYP